MPPQALFLCSPCELCCRIKGGANGSARLLLVWSSVRAGERWEVQLVGSCSTSVCRGDLQAVGCSWPGNSGRRALRVMKKAHNFVVYSCRRCPYCELSLQFADLYGKKAAALYTQAGDYQKTARFYYKKAEDTYYQVRRHCPVACDVIFAPSSQFGAPGRCLFACPAAGQAHRRHVAAGKSQTLGGSCAKFSREISPAIHVYPH